MSITVISGADKQYKDFYFKVKEDCYRLGYDFIGYDFGGINDGIPIEMELHNPTDFSNYVGKIPTKPKMLLDALKRANGLIVYVDSDVRLLEDFRGFTDDFDIGVTIHGEEMRDREGERYGHITGWLNAGVIFFNPNENSERFINNWIEYIDKSSAKSDQEGLTMYLRENISDWMEGDHEFDGIKVRFLPCREYNSTSQYGFEGNPKIIHFTGTIEEKLNNGILR